MQPHTETANLRETEQPTIQRHAAPILGVSERVIASSALETGRARRLPFLHPGKESLIGAFHAQDHILQDLRIDLGQLRTRHFEIRQFGFLLVVRDGDTATFPRGFALFQRRVVERATAP